MPILDVARNRHLESDGQEIRVGHDFRPLFFAAFLIHMAYVSRSQKMCIYKYVQKYVKLSALKTMSPKQRHLP